MFRQNLRHTGLSPYTGPSSPVLAWSYKTGGSNHPSIGSNEKLYIGSADHNIYSINSNASLHWSYQTTNWIVSSPAIGSDGKIYINSPDNIYSISSIGGLAWSYRIKGGGFSIAESSPAIDSNGRVYFGSGAGCLYSIESNAILAWSYEEVDSSSSPAIDLDGKVYIGSGYYDKNLYSFNSNGSLDWSYTTGNINGSSSPAIDSDGKVYSSSQDVLYCVSSIGALAWSYETVGGFSSPAIDSDGKMYIGAQDRLYCISSIAALAWSYKVADSFPSPAIDSDGEVFITSLYNLYSIHSTGTLGWSYQTVGFVSPSPMLGSRGKMYGSLGDNDLYCIYCIMPQGEMVLNGSSFARGDFFSATFQLNGSITRRFTAYAVVIMPDGSMLDVRTLGPSLRPVAKKVRHLDSPFSCSFLSLNIPSDSPLGQYEVVAAFFDPSKPIRGRQDALLDVSAKFAVR